MSTTTSLETESTSLKRVIAASSIGNFVEWFDFAVYGFLASTITSVFFPESNSTTGLLKTFAVFAVAFAFRPLGGIFFGVIGDKIGRKRTLALTIIIMASATTLIGLLPTYSAIGASSAFLLTAIRCVQSFSAGGEYAGACAYVMEHAPHKRRAFYGSFVPVATFSSFACAAIAAYVLETSLTHEQMVAWGWRVPFLIAAPIGLIGLYLRLNLDETPAFKEVAEIETAQASLAATLRSQVANIIKLGAFVSLTALSFYFFTTYFATYLHVSGNFSQSTSLGLTVIALLFAAAISPVLGWFSDTVGRPITIATTGLLIIITVYPALALGASGHVGYAFIGLLLFSLWGNDVWRGDSAAHVGSLYHTRALYGLGHHLQPGIYHLRRNGAFHRDLANIFHGQQYQPCLLFDCHFHHGSGGRPSIEKPLPRPIAARVSV